MSIFCRGDKAVHPATESLQDEPLTDEAIEAILAAENVVAPESASPVSSVHLVESASSAAAWVKWLLFIALASEFLVGWFRR